MATVLFEAEFMDWTSESNRNDTEVAIPPDSNRVHVFFSESESDHCHAGTETHTMSKYEDSCQYTANTHSNMICLSQDLQVAVQRYLWSNDFACLMQLDVRRAIKYCSEKAT